MSIEAIYDYETSIEDAVESVLETAGLAVLTPSDPPKQQSDRPRIEIVFQAGAARRSFHTVSGVQRNATWIGTLGVQVVTDLLMSEHREYRARVRHALTASALNAVCHAHDIQGIYEQGTQPTYKSDGGYFISSMQFEIHFGVPSDAWVELTT